MVTIRSWLGYSARIALEEAVWVIARSMIAYAMLAVPIVVVGLVLLGIDSLDGSADNVLTIVLGCAGIPAVVLFVWATVERIRYYLRHRPIIGTVIRADGFSWYDTDGDDVRGLRLDCCPGTDFQTTAKWSSSVFLGTRAIVWIRRGLDPSAERTVKVASADWI